MSDKNYNKYFSYQLDNFQQNSIKYIDEGFHILATAHTGAGKSTLAEFKIFDLIENYPDKRVFYTGPIKSLMNQKYSDFCNMIGKENVGILTGDIKLNENAPIVTMTTEIFRDMVTKNKDLDNVCAVIFDEVHYINDQSRGYVWEECIMRMPDNIQMIMLSATFENSLDFTRWIEKIKKKEVKIVGTPVRPVPLEFYGFNEGKEYFLMNNTQNIQYDIVKSFLDSFKPSQDPMKNKKKIYSPVQTLNFFIKKMEEKQRLPLLFFVFNRKKCMDYAKKMICSLNNHHEIAEIKKICDFTFNKDLAYMKQKYYVQDIVQLAEKGVGYHHSGMIPILKEFVEKLFAKNLIKVLFATETFAVGINMPTRTVCFPFLEKNDGCTRFLRNDEFIQMSGRAGRRGKDDKGFVYYLPFENNPYSQLELTSVLKGKGKIINSRFKLKPALFLNYLNEPESFSESLYFQEIQGQIKKYYDDISKLENIDVSKDFLNNSDKNMLNEYFELKSQLNIAKGKNKKRLEMKLRQMEKDFSKNIVLFMKKQEEKQESKNRIEELNLEIEELKNFSKNIYNQGLNIVKKCLDENNELNIYGKIVKQLNYQNEFLISKLICDNVFEQMEIEDIIVSTSLFLEEKNKDMEPIPTNIQEIHEKLMAEYPEQEGYFNIYRQYLYTDIINVLYEWLEGKKLEELNLNVDVGIFIKNVFQINEILEKIILILNELGKENLANSIMAFKNEKLIRDETIFNSIYLRK